MPLRTFGLTLLAVVPALALTPLACSSGSPLPPGLQNTGNGGPPPGGGGGGNGGGDAAAVGNGDTGATTTECTSLDLNTVGPCETVKPSTPPEPAGGTIVGGTYGLVTVNLYKGVDASAQQSTCDVRYALTFTPSSTTTGSVQLAYELGQEELLQTASGTYTTNGNLLTFVFSCQATNGTSVSPMTSYAAYTAESTDLRLYGAPFSTSPTSLDFSTEYVFGPR